MYHWFLQKWSVKDQKTDSPVFALDFVCDASQLVKYKSHDCRSFLSFDYIFSNTFCLKVLLNISTIVSSQYSCFRAVFKWLTCYLQSSSLWFFDLVRLNFPPDFLKLVFRAKVFITSMMSVGHASYCAVVTCPINGRFKISRNTGKKGLPVLGLKNHLAW